VGSVIPSAAARGSPVAPHGSADVVPAAGGDHVLGDDAGGAHAFSVAGAGAGGVHESWLGADEGGEPHGSCDPAGRSASPARGAFQRSAPGAGCVDVPHCSDAGGGAQAFPDGSAGA
jgi:hypothetical protein